MSRRVRGDRAFRQLINRLPGSVRQQLVGQLKITGTQVLAQQRASAPFRTGATKQALSMRVLPGSLKLKVGLIGKPINRKLFYDWFNQKGRKAGGRGIKRGSAKYSQGIGATPARNFIYFPRDQIYAPFRNLWDKALKNASAGLSDE